MHPSESELQLLKDLQQLLRQPRSQEIISAGEFADAENRLPPDEMLLRFARATGGVRVQPPSLALCAIVTAGVALVPRVVERHRPLETQPGRLWLAAAAISR